MLAKPKRLECEECPLTVWCERVGSSPQDGRQCQLLGGIFGGYQGLRPASKDTVVGAKALAEGKDLSGLFVSFVAVPCEVRVGMEMTIVLHPKLEERWYGSGSAIDGIAQR